jgi:mannosyltransferase OCH1-like enzyme
MKIMYIAAIVFAILLIGLYIFQHEGFLFYDEKRFTIDSSVHDMPSFTERSNGATYKQNIPFIIHQTYYTKQLDSDIYQTCLTIKNMNPEYNYAFYDDNDCRAYISQHYSPDYLKAYDMVIPGAYKADVFRYLVLYREGGIYMDCKSSTMVPLRDFIPRNATFAVFRDRPDGALLNSFMACTPHHPILKIVIDMTIDNILNKRYNENSLDITGPQTLGRAFNKFIDRPELTDINPGVYGPDRDLYILGSFFVFGKGEKGFDALADVKQRPLVSKTLKNYYNNSKRIDYHVLWEKREVFKNI